MPCVLPRLASAMLMGCTAAAIVPSSSSRVLHSPARPALRPRGAMILAAAQLEDIKAAPPAALAPFSLAEAVSIQGFPEMPWRYALRALVTNETFLEQGWARRPFKLKQKWEFAVNAYTMEDVERDVSMLPPQFVAHGMQWGNGIYNKPMDAGFSFEDVSRTMSGATVVMLNAGFIIPSLAKVSLATLEATRLPIWLNVYLTRPGLTSSTQLHTDKQDVLVVQTTGRKRWRVYAPPEPVEAAELDPFARGKGTDQMDASKLTLLVDTVMAPGQVLYIPAAFPHETDTVGEAVSEKESSVHLTIGVDTHLWGLSWAQARATALQRAGLPPTLIDGAPVNCLPLDRWSLLHSPLPVGFAAAPYLSPFCHGDGGLSAARAEEKLCAAMSDELARRMAEAEPTRWDSAAAVSAAVPVSNAATRMLEHHRAVLAQQTRMYLRAAHSSPRSSRERAAAQAALFDDMDALDLSMSQLDAWGRGVEAPQTPTDATAPIGNSPAPAAKTGGFGAAAAQTKNVKGGKKKSKAR